MHALRSAENVACQEAVHAFPVPGQAEATVQPSDGAFHTSVLRQHLTGTMAARAWCAAPGQLRCRHDVPTPSTASAARSRQWPWPTSQDGDGQAFEGYAAMDIRAGRRGMERRNGRQANASREWPTMHAMTAR